MLYGLGQEQYRHGAIFVEPGATQPREGGAATPEGTSYEEERAGQLVEVRRRLDAMLLVLADELGVAETELADLSAEERLVVLADEAGVSRGEIEIWQQECLGSDQYEQCFRDRAAAVVVEKRQQWVKWGLVGAVVLGVGVGVYVLTK